MEDIINNENEQTGPAPKIEKISLAELKAETQKLSKNEDKQLKEQREREKAHEKEREEALKQKEKEEYEQFEKEFEMFIASINSFSDEDKKKFEEFLENPNKK